jgi:hypothetical protein
MRNMKRITTIPVLLLAIILVAASAPAPTAYAVPTSGTTSVLSGTSSTNPPATVGSNPAGGGETGQGDPGGAGDGLGADLESAAPGSGQAGGASAAVELILQLLRLMQAAG